VIDRVRIQINIIALDMIKNGEISQIFNLNFSLQMHSTIPRFDNTLAILNKTTVHNKLDSEGSQKRIKRLIKIVIDV